MNKTFKEIENQARDETQAITKDIKTKLESTNYTVILSHKQILSIMQFAEKSSDFTLLNKIVTAEKVSN